MSKWIAELTEIGYELFGRSSPGEMWALVAVCVMGVSVVLLLEKPLVRSVQKGIDRGSLVKDRRSETEKAGR